MPPRKKAHSYLLPFVVILLLVAAIVGAWWGLNRFLTGESQSTLNEKVFLNIEAGSAKAMTVGKSEWQNAPDKIYLYRGEGLKTANDGRATLTFFDQSIMRLNTNTETSFTSLKKKDESFNINVELNKGDLWTKVSPIVNPDSKFGITTDLITVDTRGGVISVTAPSTVYVIQGSAQIGVKFNDDVVKTYTLGVGQQFSLDPAKVESIKKGEDVEVIFALSDQFRKTSWYHWNAKKDGMIDAFEESGDEPTADSDTGSSTTTVTVSLPGDTTATGTDTSSVTVGSATPIGSESSTPLANMDRVAYVTKPTQNFATSKSSIAVEGNYDSAKVKAVYVNGAKATVVSDGKWKVDSVKMGLEGDNTIKLEAEDMAGKKTALESLTVVYDKTAPATPVITEPKSATPGASIDIASVEQLIKGTVSADTQAVIVNDYRLGKYVPGSKAWQYYAKVEYGNLNAGENEFKVIAEDKAGNQSEPATLILKLTQEVIDAAGVKPPVADTPSDTVTTAPSTSSTATPAPATNTSGTGGVSITAPNGGADLKTSETEFEIAGTVPEGTAKVTVNDYALSLFASGSTSFKYRAFKSIGNLEIGKANVYTVKAYDDAGKVLGSDSITIDVQSGASADPVVTIPTEASTYSTTLDTLVVGGTVGKWVTRVYVNDKELTEYIPGSEKWSTSVKLQSGKNTFTVSGERNGVQTGKDSIEINYQQ
ncbi:FecR domain-containing protein [Candidatus Peregrinibacteria bacterium]|nr:FecR domain-containing protein [Candidatus Peregrinibacteria bacterium]